MRRDLPADLGGDDEFIMEHAGQGDLSLPHSGCPATHKFHRTQCIYELVLESQLHHKIVNLLFSVTT